MNKKILYQMNTLDKVNNITMYIKLQEKINEL